LRPGADKEIHGKLATIAHVIEANAEMELPEVVYNNIYVELPPSARKVYRDLETQLISNVQSNKIIADGAAAATIKCRQIASGAVYHDATVEEQETVSYRPYLELHDEKIEALKLLVNELQGAPLFVAYDFEHDLIRIKKSLGGNVPHLGSGCKDPESIVAQWNRGEIPVLLGHPASVGHGLNLQGSCNYVCWFSLTYNYDLYDQFNRRIRRTGNKFDRVFVYHLVARGTLDETIIDEVLPRKEKGQNALFAALKNKL
jgi:hypothetical protein